ncbi:heterokaryon incompatibility protein-domain-containing protein [Phaeosphaeria sp. MPI-PUGE-AT-0046c]|nr:heterokaryon incompatibility protein-domain-containing protein [Phaeosphaeria sp. MPI-PUGE-AT-0046c]
MFSNVLPASLINAHSTMQRPAHREIRVLDILPGHRGDSIHCTLRIVSLDSDEKYEAQSYIWGISYASRSIDVAGQHVSVTENLYGALQRLRLPAEPRTIWIDQLCIDQTDNLERSTQVAMMRDIYRRCCCCILWLGELQEISVQSATDVFSFIEQAAAVKTTPISGLPTLLQDTTEGEAARAAFAAISMYGNTWWSRIWTVQEAIIPPYALLTWGPLSVSRDDVLMAAVHLKSTGMHTKFTSDFIEKRLQHSELLRRMLYPVRGFLHAHSNTDGPLDLLMRWRHREASNPRDKVYALMGLLPTEVLPSARHYSYESPAASLFANVTFDLIEEEQSLRALIGSSEMPHLTPDLPTWAIDFANSNHVGWRQLKWWNHSHRYHQFSACGSGSFETVLRDSGRILALTGSMVDQVEVTSEAYEVPDSEPIPSDKLLETILTWKDLLRKWCKERGTSPEYVTGGSWHSAFAQTVVGGLVMQEFPISRTNATSTKDFDELLNTLANNATNAKLYESACGMVPNHVFFITGKGYLGVGPPRTRAGDDVWILHGGRVPFILRTLEAGTEANSKRRTLVGDAYVHGIMDGEAVEEGQVQSIWLY